MKRSWIFILSGLLSVTLILLLIILSNGGGPYLLGAHISDDFYESLKRTGEYKTSAFVLASDRDKKVSTMEIKLDLRNFIEILDTLNSNEGLLFYPGIASEDSKEIVYLMASMEEQNNKLDKYIYVLDSDLSDYESIDSKRVEYDMTLYENYKKWIVPVDSIYKYPSRYYSRNELIEMLIDCDVDLYADDLNKYNRWNLEIKGAAIKYENLDHLQKYHPTQKPDGYDWKYHVGFTVVLRVKQWGIQRGPAYEIGRPCPPRCGELSY